MQQPGLSRAIPAGILGFLIGAGLVYVIRALQQVDPVWSPGVGLVFGTIFCAGFFIWGIGAFDPKLSLHGEEAEAELARQAATEPKPGFILGRSIWQITTITLLVTLALVVFAFLPGGFTLTTTADPLASRTALGYFPVEINGETVLVSELVVFLVFAVVMIVSLLIVAALLGWLFTWLNRNVKEVEVAAKAKPKAAPALAAAETAGELPSGMAAPAPRVKKELPDLRTRDLVPPRPTSGGIFGWLVWLILIPIKIFIAFIRPADPTPVNWVRSIAVFAITFTVLYLLFYYVAIGLIFPWLPNLELISAINALLFTFLILRTKYVLQLNGMIAGMLARALRTVPDALQ